MRVLYRLFLVLVFLVLGGGIAFLAAWDIPAPVRHIEQTIPNDRFGF